MFPHNNNNTTTVFFFVFTDVIGTNSVLIKILEPIEDTICTTFRGKYQYTVSLYMQSGRQ